VKPCCPRLFRGQEGETSQHEGYPGTGEDEQRRARDDQRPPAGEAYRAPGPA
jgi:hypothetical protein